jgi:protease YdgD
MSDKNVFNDDHRRKVTNKSAPWSAVGRLESPGGDYCTASLVSSDLILTNAHCVIKSGSLVKGDYIFYPGYSDGKAKLSSGVNWIWWGTTEPDAGTLSGRAQDWAILRLNTPLGNTAGWFGVSSLAETELVSVKFYMAGYSGDFENGSSASWEKGCSFTSLVLEGFIHHDCDMSRGASGSPIFYFDGEGKNHLIALNAAELRDGGSESLIGIPYSDDHANIAVPASAFLPRLSEILGR